MITNANIREMARIRLRGNWAYAVLVFFLYGVIVSAVSWFPGIGYVAGLVIAGPLALGVSAYFLRLIRAQGPQLEVMFSGFQQFGSAFVLCLLQAVFIFLWSLLFVIPGIVAALRYSMAYYILHDHPGMSGMEALRQSGLMTQGYKGKLFGLLISFIGWALLCMFTFGIGFLWLMPYIQTAHAAFYEHVRALYSPMTQAPPRGPTGPPYYNA